jgi:flagellar protein FlaF
MLSDDQTGARQPQQIALAHAVTLLERAALQGSGASETATAIDFTRKLWTLLIEDLAGSSDGLPRDLRRQIISIGIWILRELEAVRSRERPGLADVIAVSKAIRDGVL